MSQLQPRPGTPGSSGLFGGPYLSPCRGETGTGRERADFHALGGHGACVHPHSIGHKLCATCSQRPTPQALGPECIWLVGVGHGQGGRRPPGSLTPACPRSVDTDESRYPQKLAFAECLCRGCISAKTGRETAALNSVPLVQSLLVLRRRPCSRDTTGVPTPGAFAFHAEFIRVPVGCTCVLPRSAR